MAIKLLKRAGRGAAILITWALLFFPALLFAGSKPGWWAERAAILESRAADDFAIANLGQLKQMASKAREELNEWLLPGGAGPEVDALIESFGVNLTQLPGASASQSSTAYEGFPALGIDNNTDGDYARASVTHTAGPLTPEGASNPAWQDPWFQVDLGATRSIRAVELWNRSDKGLGARLANFYFFLSESDMAGSTLKTLLGSNSVWKSPRITAPPSPSLRVEAGSRRGRYVMVRIEGPQYLHLAELKVFGSPNASAPAPDDFAALTLGQLKRAAKPFYMRMAAAGLKTSLPWLGRERLADDLALANLGQLKSLFSFDVRPLSPEGDSNENGIPDWWEYLYTGQPIGDPDADSDGDGVPDAKEYLAGSNPNAADTDLDGLSDAEEIALGTNPNSADSDGDGIKDKADLYPTDPRRSGDIALLRYAAIDVSTPLVGEEEIALVALDDLNKTAFARPGVENVESFCVAPGGFGGAIVPSRLPLLRDPLFKNLTENKVEYVLREQYSYKVAGINAEGALVLNVSLHATLCRKLAKDEPAPPPGPLPIPSMADYPILVQETGIAAAAVWSGGVFPSITRVGLLPLAYADPHLNYSGGGIANGGIYWGRDGEDDFNTFLGDTVFPDASAKAGRPGFSFSSSLVSADGGAAAGIVQNLQSPYLPYAGCWKANGFRPIFGTNDMETEPQLIDNKAGIFGFSPRFSKGLYFEHLEPKARHPFWQADGEAVDFYGKLPKQFQQQIVFLEGDRGVAINSLGDMVLYAHAADLLEGQPAWRQALLLWEAPKEGKEARLREIELPEGFELKQLNAKLALAGLLKKPRHGPDGKPIADPARPGKFVETNRATLLVPAELVPEYRRDGVIDDQDRGKITADNPFRFWINDDSDSGDLGDKGIPLSTPGHAAGNASVDLVVNGTRDLIDFFPVFLDIKELIKLLPPERYDYRLKNDDSHLNFVYTELSPEKADSYLKDIGREGINDRRSARSLGSAATIHIGNDQGVVLDPGFLAKIKEEGKGVMLFEAALEVTRPLKVEVWEKTGNKKVSELSLQLSIEPVETMYRHINLLGIEQMSQGHPTSLGIPANYPDTLCNKKNFIFVHGYNVNPQQARGWNAKMFKSMWWAGSKARFYGTTWEGAESQRAQYATPNFHVNVDNAFGCAHRFAAILSQLDGESNVAAHSLGNMLVGSALHDWQAKIPRYFMFNSAVAIEAYDGKAIQDPFMAHQEWQPPSQLPLETYSQRLWASEWYRLSSFPANDSRRTLTWRDRLRGVNRAIVYNFYSSGDEVLAPPDQFTPTANEAVGEQLYNAVFGSNPQGERSWTLQEKLKGRTLTGQVLGSTYGGWGFNPRRYIMREPGFSQRRSPMEASVFTDEELVIDPIFFFGPPDLHAANGGAYAALHRNTLLAEMFPARTRPAGGNPILGTTFNRDDQVHNFEMTSNEIRNGWPIGRPTKNWMHSDMYDVAFPYTRQIFERMKTLGKLDQ